jgi:hypothetical protein
MLVHFPQDGADAVDYFLVTGSWWLGLEGLVQHFGGLGLSGEEKVGDLEVEGWFGWRGHNADGGTSPLVELFLFQFPLQQNRSFFQVGVLGEENIDLLHHLPDLSFQLILLTAEYGVDAIQLFFSTP